MVEPSASGATFPASRFPFPGVHASSRSDGRHVPPGVPISTVATSVSANPLSCTMSAYTRYAPVASGGRAASNVVESSGRGWRCANALTLESRTRNRCIRCPWSGTSGVHWRRGLVHVVSSMASRNTRPPPATRTVAVAWSAWYNPERYWASTAFHHGCPDERDRSHAEKDPEREQSRTERPLQRQASGGHGHHRHLRCADAGIALDGHLHAV